MNDDGGVSTPPSYEPPPPGRLTEAGGAGGEMLPLDMLAPAVRGTGPDPTKPLPTLLERKGTLKNRP